MPGLTVPQPKQPTIVQPGETENQLVQGYRKAGEEMEQRTAPLRSEMQSIEQSITQQGPAPQPPKLQEVPKFQGREYDGNQALLVGNIALALGAIMGKTVRGDIGLALNTAGEAMKGFNTGNIEQARVERENFNTKMQSIIANNKTMLEEYDRVMKDRALSMTEKMNRFRILSTRYNDEVGMAAAKKGDIKFELERLDKIRNANNQLETRLAQMQHQWDGMMARMELQQARIASMNPNAGHTQYTPEAIDMLAHAAIKDRQSLANIGRGVQGARDLAAVNNRIAEILAQEKGGPDLAAQRAEYRANSNSLNKMVMQYDAITSFEKNALANGKQLVDLAEKVDATGMPVLERWIRAGRRSVQGDPDVSAFNTQMVLFRAEAARILTNPNLTGALTVHAQQEAESFVNGNDSAEQIAKVVSLLEVDFGRRERFLVEQMNTARDRMSRSAGAGAQQPATVANDADYNALPSGAEFVGPDGKRRRKP